MARAERSGAGAFLVRPLGGGGGGTGAASVRARVCSHRGGPAQWPGSPATRGGCPAAAAVYQRLHRPVRGWLRRQAYRCEQLEREPWPASHRAPPVAGSATRAAPGRYRGTPRRLSRRKCACLRRGVIHTCWGKGGVPGGQQLLSGELGWFACGGSRRESASEQRDSMRSCGAGATTRPVSPSRPDRRGCCPEERVIGRRGRGARGPCVLPRPGAARGRDAASLAVPLLRAGRHGLLARCVRPYASHGTIEALETRDVVLTGGTKPWKTGACFLSRTSVGFRGL